jgi:hypothetical protein
LDRNLPHSRVNETLSKIRETLGRAQQIVWRWESRGGDSDETEEVEFLVEYAFVELLVLLEVAGLPETLKSVKSLDKKAKSDYGAVRSSAEGLYLAWSSKLTPYLSAVQDTLGGPIIQTVTKDIVEILRNTQYAITDRACFTSPPQNEPEVHARIEAVLQCVFPDLISKPPIQKPIKSFQPDTGLPSAQTLIEYKYVASQADAKRIVDEVLADTRAYSSPEWSKFIYVIYETKRIKSERQWKELFHKSGIGEDTEIIVLHGEKPYRTSRKKEKATLR